MVSVGGAGGDEPADEVGDDSPAHQTEDDGEDADYRGIDVEVFAQSAANAGDVSVVVG